MNDFTPGRANRAAAGIRPVVSVPGASRPAPPRAAIRTKPTASTLKSLAALHDAKRRGGRPAPLDGGAVRHLRADAASHPLRVSAQIAPALHRPGVVIRPAVIHDRPDAEALMTAAILGQFLVENDEGRTRIAKAVVAHVRSTNARHGMDGLLLSALLHLERVGDPARADAMDTWRNTIASSGSPDNGDSGVVVDGSSDKMGSVSHAVFADPFKNGLARPAVFDHLAELRGGDVMIGHAALAASLIIAGAIKGAIAGHEKGGAEGALRGAFEGAGSAIFGIFREIGGVAGAAFDALAGWVTSTNEEARQGANNAKQSDLDAKQAAQDMKDTTKESKPEDNSKDIDNQNKDPKGGDDGGSPEPEVPPPDSSFPAPDDGGGTPWTLIGFGPLVTVRSVRAMLAQQPAGAIELSHISGLNAFRSAFAAREPVLSQAHQLTDRAQKLDASRLAALDTSARAFETALVAIGKQAGKSVPGH